MTNTNLSKDQCRALIVELKSRFEGNMHLHDAIKWMDVQRKLESASEAKLWSLNKMEMTGGEPDIVAYDESADEYVFYDCSKESPNGRRSVCYDRKALESRKANKPSTNALDMAHSMGIELLTEADYYQLQQLGEFDTKTSSWVQTPDEIRKHGGALFCDYRFGKVFTYLNGAESYFAARGFRGKLRV